MKPAVRIKKHIPVYAAIRSLLVLMLTGSIEFSVGGLGVGSGIYAEPMSTIMTIVASDVIKKKWRICIRMVDIEILFGLSAIGVSGNGGRINALNVDSILVSA